MSKKSEKSFDIPKGFRLTEGTREKMVRVVVSRKYGAEIERLYNEEVEIFNCITEYFNDRVRLAVFVAAAGAIGTEVNVRRDLFELCRNVDIYEGRDRVCNIGYRHRWVDSRDGTELLQDLISNIGASKEEARGYFYCRLPVFFSGGIDINTLPPPLRRRIYTLIDSAPLLRRAVGALREKTMEVLLYYSSVIALLEIAPMFEEVIKEAVKIDDPVSCTDIPQADKIQELKRLL